VGEKGKRKSKWKSTFLHPTVLPQKAVPALNADLGRIGNRQYLVRERERKKRESGPLILREDEDVGEFNIGRSYAIERSKCVVGSVGSLKVYRCESGCRGGEKKRGAGGLQTFLFSSGGIILSVYPICKKGRKKKRYEG